MITEGTKSYLIGCHQFFIHPLMVTIAWKKLYGRPPKMWELVCIFLHDIGHIGKDFLSSYKEKCSHWVLGARIASWLFGERGYFSVAGHTTQSGHPRSKLFYADKYSWLIAPRWWLRLNDKVEGFGSDRSLDEWLALMKENFENGCEKGSHQIYLELSCDRHKITTR